MKAFRVVARTERQYFAFYAIGRCSSSVHRDAQDRFDGPCGVTVIPL